MGTIGQMDELRGQKSGQMATFEIVFGHDCPNWWARKTAENQGSGYSFGQNLPTCPLFLLNFYFGEKNSYTRKFAKRDSKVGFWPRPPSAHSFG
ncbi:hypothetical protein PBI_CAMILLE_73 [Microbacterium phage Camille]|nr:hypothetical protein PBI_CAMILLE_73 [Microbacterium phage Camille]